MNPRRWLLARAPGLFARCCEPDTAELGLLGEELAARHLRAQGWELVGRRVRTRAGEVDLVARERGELVCIEVKTARAERVAAPRGVDPARTLVGDEPAGHLRAPQRARLAESARLLARELGSSPGRVRLDLIEVVLERAPRRVELRHHRGRAGAGAPRP